MENRVLRITADAGRTQKMRFYSGMVETKPYPLSDKEFTRRFQLLHNSAHHEIGNSLAALVAQIYRTKSFSFEELSISSNPFIKLGALLYFIRTRTINEHEIHLFSKSELNQLFQKKIIDYSKVREIALSEINKLRTGICKIIEITNTLFGQDVQGRISSDAVKLEKHGTILCYELEALMLGKQEILEGKFQSIFPIMQAIKESVYEYPSYELSLDKFNVLCSLSSLLLISRNIHDNSRRSAKQAARNLELQVFLEQKNGKLAISFNDNGAGMNEETMKKLNSDERVTTKSRDIPGEHGLGFLTCREYARMMGGKLYVESTSPEGSVIVLELKLV
ncbi:ATP-binding protein [Candidatus Micrarchaeota archaeon]|nr:ATP-binding protein [Candidatus Micrarchaeota archaeon]